LQVQQRLREQFFEMFFHGVISSLAAGTGREPAALF
jgi:hypothetical protein